MYERYRPKKQNIISDTGTTIKNYCINMIINITGHYFFFFRNESEQCAGASSNDDQGLQRRLSQLELRETRMDLNRVLRLNPQSQLLDRDK